MYKLNWRRWNNKQVVSICIISKLDNGPDHEIIPSPPHFQFVQRPTFLPYCIFDTMELSLAPCSARNWEAGCLLLLKHQGTDLWTLTCSMARWAQAPEYSSRVGEFKPLWRSGDRHLFSMEVHHHVAGGRVLICSEWLLFNTAEL